MYIYIRCIGIFMCMYICIHIYMYTYISNAAAHTPNDYRVIPQVSKCRWQVQNGAQNSLFVFSPFSITHSRTLSRTNTLSLSLAHTHTHTRSLSLFFSVSHLTSLPLPSPSPSPSPSPLLSLSHSCSVYSCLFHTGVCWWNQNWRTKQSLLSQHEVGFRLWADGAHGSCGGESAQRSSLILC